MVPFPACYVSLPECIFFVRFRDPFTICQQTVQWLLYFNTCFLYLPGCGQTFYHFHFCHKFGGESFLPSTSTNWQKLVVIYFRQKLLLLGTRYTHKLHLNPPIQNSSDKWGCLTFHLTPCPNSMIAKKKIAIFNQFEIPTITSPQQVYKFHPQKKNSRFKTQVTLTRPLIEVTSVTPLKGSRFHHPKKADPSHPGSVGLDQKSTLILRTYIHGSLG